MKTISALLIFALVGCAAPRGIGSGPDSVRNGCVIQAVYAAQRLEDAGVKTRVLGVCRDLRGKKQGHAVTVFWFRGETYVYDANVGSALVSDKIEKNPLEIAFACVWLRGHADARYAAKYLSR